MKYFVSAGELSGDMHLSHIVREIKKINSESEFVGMGGKHLKDSGVELLENIENTAVMGFGEIIGKFNYMKKKADSFVKYILSNKIKNVILIDYGGFNLYLLEKLKKMDGSIKIFYYIPPKLWVWGEKRIKKLRKADHILAIFPWEVDFYRKHGVEVIYFGNPLVDFHEKIDTLGNKILLLPGSRKQELKTLIPEMIRTAELLPEKKFILKPAENKTIELFKEKIEKVKNIEIADETMTLEDAAKKSFCAVAASGTVTLETALIGLPTVVAYKVSIISEIIARFIIKIKYVSLPNIILGKLFFTELLQDKCNAENIVKEIIKIEKNKDFQNGFKEIRELLGGKEIVKKYAEYINNHK